MKRILAMRLLPILLLFWREASAAEWTTFENCVLVEKDYRDGDSFHVKNEKGRKYEFRLYFVDSPETDKRFPDRLKEQGDYFGGLTEEEVLLVGEKAAEFTEKFLKGTFTVHTKYSNTPNNKGRYYAILEKDGVSLAEALVEKGLARIYGVEVTPPGAATEKAYELRLKGKENQAKKDGLGGWAKSAKARAAQARGAEPAAWKVEEQDANTRVQAVLLSALPPHGVIGTLRQGEPVRVLGSSTNPGKVRIRFNRNGQPAEALVDRTALGL
jgi:endonuclease YncB( thermonuclease family)